MPRGRSCLIMASAAELRTVCLNDFDDEPIHEGVDLPDVDCILETPPESKSDCELEEGVDILEVAGFAFVYRIPRFPVVTIRNLRQITFRGVLSVPHKCSCSIPEIVIFVYGPTCITKSM